MCQSHLSKDQSWSLCCQGEQVAVCFIVSRELAIKSDEWGCRLVQWMQTTQCSSLPFSQYDPPISIDSPSFLKCFLCSLDCVKHTLPMCSCVCVLFICVKSRPLHQVSELLHEHSLFIWFPSEIFKCILQASMFAILKPSSPDYKICYFGLF